MEMTRTSNIILNKCGESRYFLSLILLLGGSHYFTIKHKVEYSFVVEAFYQVEEVHLKSYFIEVFIMNRCWTLSNILKGLRL